MADTTKTTEELKIETLFVDGDTRSFNVKNPKSEITSAQISSLNEYMQTNNILVGDKYGGRFGKILAATRVRKTQVNLDLSDDS